MSSLYGTVEYSFILANNNLTKQKEERQWYLKKSSRQEPSAKLRGVQSAVT